jgi:DNA-binding response OmpR family regulator
VEKALIYLVDDNQDLQDTISENLADDGYDVTQILNAESLFANLESAEPDTILLDLMLPDANGLNLIERIRTYTNAPIIVISGKGKMVDKVVGLEVGADDYIGKPFEMRELLARVKAHVRRHKSHGKQKKDEATPYIRFGQWTLDQEKMQIFDEDGQSGGLTAKEYRLLESFIKSPDRVLSREQLLDKSRDDSAEVFDRTIDIQITRIRKKIGDDASNPQIIKTVRGMGYMFVSDKNRKDR